MSPADIRLVECVGEGSFGEVWLAEYCGALVAVKILAKASRWWCGFGDCGWDLRACWPSMAARWLAPSTHNRSKANQAKPNQTCPASFAPPHPTPSGPQVKSDFMTHSMQQQLALRNLQKEAMLMSKLRHPNGERPCTRQHVLRLLCLQWPCSLLCARLLHRHARQHSSMQALPVPCRCLAAAAAHTAPLPCRPPPLPAVCLYLGAVSNPPCLVMEVRCAA